MRRLFAALILLILIFQLDSAKAESHDDKNPTESAIRAGDEDWTAAAARHMRGAIDVQASRSVLSHANSFADLAANLTDVSPLPEWPLGESMLIDYFEVARDERIYKDPSGFRRRPTWLYPDDGCFARAAHITHVLEKVMAPPPGKVFAFGNLRFKTPYSRSGTVGWWYHVAAAYRMGAEIVVLDPAVNIQRPSTLQEWLSSISKSPEKVRVSLCDGRAYMPSSRCLGSTSNPERHASNHLKRYFRLEWKRVKSLGLDPTKALGSKPPWVAPLNTSAGEH